MRRIHRQPVLQRTCLFYCEGEECSVFLRYLKDVFYKRGNNYRVKIDFVNGNAVALFWGLKKRITQNIGYDLIVPVYDLDIKELEGANHTKAQDEIRRLYDWDGNKVKLKFLAFRPCLEAFLLKILGDDSCKNKKNCKDCKKKFEKKYIQSRRRTNKDAYAEVFPQELLGTRVAERDMTDLRFVVDIFRGKGCE